MRNYLKSSSWLQAQNLILGMAQPGRIRSGAGISRGFDSCDVCRLHAKQWKTLVMWFPIWFELLTVLRLTSHPSRCNSYLPSVVTQVQVDQYKCATHQCLSNHWLLTASLMLLRYNKFETSQPMLHLFLYIAFAHFHLFQASTTCFPHKIYYTQRCWRDSHGK